MSSPEELKALVRRFYDEAWNKNNMGIYDEVVAEDFVDHRPAPGMPPGRDGFRQLNMILRAAFPDVVVTIEDVISDGEKVAARWRSVGTHQGDLWGVPPSGNKVDFTAIVWYRTRDGQLAEGWISRDDLTLLRQVGAIPSPE